MKQMSKEDRKKLMKKFYRERPEVKERIRKNRMVKYLRNREFINNYKKDKKCELCGYLDHPEVLVFHHKKGEKKSFNLSNTKQFPIERIKKEIGKCMLICANCHNFIHLRDGWVYSD